MNVPKPGSSAVSLARRRLRTGARSMGSPARASAGPLAVTTVWSRSAYSWWLLPSNSKNSPSIIGTTTRVNLSTLDRSEDASVKRPPMSSRPMPKYRLEPALIDPAQREIGSMTTAANEPSRRLAARTMARRMPARRISGSRVALKPPISKANSCSIVCTTISPSLSDSTLWPSPVSHALSASQFVTLPLCAPYKLILQPTTCGCELASVTAPNVAQRT